MVMPRDEIRGADFIDKLIQEEGYYAEGKKAGKPSTKQEESFILDFMQSTGRAPTENEVNRSLRGRDTTLDEYTSYSTMGQMGFQTQKEYLAAQQYGEPYGPHSGGLVPEGTQVVTDEYGRPIRRFADPSRTPQGYLDKGQFFGEGGIVPGAPGESPIQDYSGVYPSYDRGAFQRPEMEEVLGKYSPQQVYKARLADYLTQQVEQDAPAIQQIQEAMDAEKQSLDDRLALGEIDTAEYNKAIIELRDSTTAQLENLMTEDRATELAQQSMDLIGQGTAAEELPLFADIQGVTGAGVQELYNKMVTNLEGIHKKEQAAIPEFKGYAETEMVTDIRQLEPEFMDYVRRLGVAPEYSRWLVSNFQPLYYEWIQQRDEGQTFIDFVSQYLSNGGR